MVNVDESQAPIDHIPAPDPTLKRLTDRLFRRPAHPWVAAAGVIVVILLLLELYVRGVENSSRPCARATRPR